MISDMNLFIVLIIENIKGNFFKKKVSEIKKITYEKLIRIVLTNTI